MRSRSDLGILADRSGGAADLVPPFGVDAWEITARDAIDSGMLSPFIGPPRCPVPDVPSIDLVLAPIPASPNGAKAHRRAFAYAMAQGAVAADLRDGQAAICRSGLPVPGQPSPGQPSPGQPSPGLPVPGQPSPGQPSPGRLSPGAVAGVVVVAALVGGLCVYLVTDRPTSRSNPRRRGYGRKVKR